MLNLFKKNKNSKEVIVKEEQEQVTTLTPIVNMMLYLMNLEEAYLQENKVGELITYPYDKAKMERAEILTKEMARLEKVGLKDSTNYKLLEKEYIPLRGDFDRVDKINARNREKYEFCKSLVEYVKLIKIVFGDKATLISYEALDKLCKDYKLTSGFLEDYTGVIPENNLKDLESFNTAYAALSQDESMYFDYDFKTNQVQKHKLSRDTSRGLLKKIGVRDQYFWSRTNNNYNFPYIHFYKIVNIYYSGSNDFKRELYSISEKLEDKFFINGTFDNTDNKTVMNSFELGINFPDIKDHLKRLSNNNFSFWQSRVVFEVRKLKNPLKVVCLKEDLEKKPIKITINPFPKDPIVYFDSPFGAVIITAWGEESESEILKHYSKVNNLLLNI